jgi:hypothetical protein
LQDLTPFLLVTPFLLDPVQHLVATLLVGVPIYQLIGPVVVRYGVDRGAVLAADSRTAAE